VGLSDKFKQLGDKAKEAAGEHRDQISHAVETAGAVADQRTKGKYTDKIAKVTTKTEGMVDRLANEEPAEQPPHAAPDPAATESAGPSPAPPAGPAGTSAD
jgi:hypothetical protein